MGAKDENTPTAMIRKESRILPVIEEDKLVTNYDDEFDTKCGNTNDLESSLTARHDMSPILAKKVRKRKLSTLGPSEEDLTKLKDAAKKLNLNTRRPSVMAWRAKYLDTPRLVNDVRQNVAAPPGSDRLTNDRRERINDSLAWIRTQLMDMRKMDQSLAKQFLGIRQQLNSLKLQRISEEHEDMLDSATCEMEDFQELSKFLDEPSGSYAPSPLKHIGVTKMNLSSRRFSTS